MNTKQTPEEKYEVSESKFIKGKLFMADCGQDLNGRKYYILSNKPTPHAKEFAETVVQLLNNREYKSLSTEIERLRQHNVSMMSDNIKLIDNFNALKLKLSGKTFSCPVCDSMAERNRELEEEIASLRRIDGLSKI